MSAGSNQEPLRWYLTAPVIWVFGIPHFIPLLGVYMLLGGTNEGAFLLMMAGLAATGCLLGIVEAFIVSPWALLVTPVSFVLGYAPTPYLMFGRGSNSPTSFGTVVLVTFLTSTFCVTVGQWLLSLGTHGEEATEEVE
jgi:hypothetical protein